MRWRILDRKVCYGPEKVCKIALTCCVLHKICRRNGTPLPEDTPLSGQPDSSDENSTSSIAGGLFQRQRIIEMLHS